MVDNKGEETMSAEQKGGSESKRRGGKKSRRTSDPQKVRTDFTADIEKLKNQKDKEEEAVVEAKKLRGEIEHQMEKSFEMMEERQNEVKDFLHQREKEEEEHKKRAADIVKRLENGMISFDDTSDKARSKRGRKDHEEEIGVDSKFVQTENAQLISKDAQTDDSDVGAFQSKVKGPWKEQQLNIDDIPDVIEAIKDDLVENMRMKLSDEEERLRDKDAAKELEGKTADRQSPTENGKKRLEPGFVRTKEDKEMPSSRVNDRLAELAKAAIDNEIQHENEAQNDERINVVDEVNGEPLASKSTNTIADHKDQLLHGLLCNKPNVHEVPGITSEGRKVLEEPYNRMKNEFDNLAQLLVKDKNTSAPDDVGSERLMRCRDLCRDIDSIEGIIDKLNDEIGHHANVNSSGNGLISDIIDSIDHEQDELNGDQTSAESPVAELSGDENTDNLLYGHKQIPAAMDDNKQLFELLEKKMDADMKLHSKLDELRNMLGQGDPREAEMDGEEKKRLNSDLDELAMDREELKRANSNLQKELDAIYKANKELEEENSKLRDGLEDASQRKDHNLDVELEDIGYLDIPRWENEKKMKQELAELKQRMGDEMFHELLDDLTEKEVPFEELKDHEAMRHENRNLQNLLKEYKDDIENLTERLKEGDVANDISNITKVDNQNVNRVVEELQKEAATTAKMINENEKLLNEQGNILNDLVNKRKGEAEGVEKLQKKKLDLERRLAETNKSIHEFFPLLEKKEEEEEIEKRIQEIDKEIEIIGRELKEETEDDDYEERLAELKKLERLLEKLRPHVRSEKKLKLANDEKVSIIPVESEVDEAIRSKKDLEGNLNEHNEREINEREMKNREGDDSEKRRDENEISQVKMVAIDSSENIEKLERLKDELKQTLQEMDNADVGIEDGNYLKEVVESLKTSIEDANKDIKEAKIKSEKAKRLDEELEEIEKKIQYLTEILDEKQTETLDSGESNSDEEITRQNVKEKVKNTCERLEHEKERLAEILESTHNLERERSISTIPDFAGFQERFIENTAKIKADIEDCLDDVERILKSATYKLQSEELESMEDNTNRELVQRKDKLVKLKDGMAELSRDLEMIENFEEEGEIGDITDPDIEELVYKIEAIGVSIDRMNRTIDEHVNKDGDPKTLETLIKRREKMKESQDEVKKEMNRRKEILERDLGELQNEKARIVAEIKEILGDGKISSGIEKSAMLEMIEDVKGNDVLKDNDINENLRKCLVQRQKIAVDYEDFIGLGGMTEDDGEFLSTMIDSVEADIKDRLEEIVSTCKVYDDPLAYEKEYLNGMMRNRKELESALYQLQNSNKKALKDENKLSTAKDGNDEGNINGYNELRKLAQDKMQFIDDKLERLDHITNKPLYASHIDSNMNDTQTDDDNDEKEVDKLIAEVRDELTSLQVVDKLEGDWNGITASLINDINLKNEIDDEINKLFDEREQLVNDYVKSNSVDDVDNQNKGNFDQISNVDQMILDQKNLYIEEKPASHSSPTLAGNEDLQFEEEDQRENALRSLFDERDFTVRQLFALRTRESARKYNNAEMEAAKDASTLKKDLEKRLEKLDAKIIGFKDNGVGSSPNRTQSPNLYALMKMIDDEVERLKEEVDERKLFLYGKNLPVSDEGNEIQRSSEEETNGEDEDEIKDKIVALIEERENLILQGDDEEESMNLDDVIERQKELEDALKELQSKLKLVEKKEHLEIEIERMEGGMSIENKEKDTLGEESVDTEKARIKLELDAVEDKIAEYAVAIERELGKGTPVGRRVVNHVGPDDIEDVTEVLKCRLDELINERMKLDQNKMNILKDSRNKNELQDLVDKRKEILKELNNVERELAEKSKDNGLASELHDKRKQFEIAKQKQNFLERKKQELQKVLGYLEPQKDFSFEDTTSGFSDSPEFDERNKELLLEKSKEISELKHEVEKLKGMNEDILSELEQEREKMTELDEDNNDKDEMIKRLEEEMSRLQKEIDELNKAAEAMMDVANAMDEQNQAKSLEVELNRDHIKELEKQLKEADARDWRGMEARFDEIENELKEKTNEVNELKDEKDVLNEEVESLREKMAAINDEHDNEKAKCKEMEEQIKLLEQLKDELKRKGKRVLKIDQDQLYTVSPTTESVGEDRPKSNDFKNEIDKVSAVEEIMKLAAEMTSENERRAEECKNLEAQKEELTQILEELLEKCQAQSEEIQNLEKKMKEIEETKASDVTLEKIEKEEDIVPMENRILMDEPEIDFREDLDALKTRVTILSNEKEQLKDDMEEAMMKINDLDNDLKSKEEMLKSAENQIEELMGTVRNLFAKNDELEGKVAKEEQLRKKQARENDEKIIRKDEEVTKERNISGENRRRADDLELEKQQLEHELLLKTTKNEFMSKQLAILEKDKEDAMKVLFNENKKLEKQRKLLMNEKEDLAGRLKEKCDELAKLKSEADIMKMNYEQKGLKNEREIKKFIAKLEEANDSYEELQKNFDRMKKAKENILVDCEKQIRGLLDEITTLREIEARLQDRLKKKEDHVISLNKKMDDEREDITQRLRREMEELMKERKKETVNEMNKRRDAETKFEKEINDFKRKFHETEKARENTIEALEERIEKLKVELQKKDRKIYESESLKNYLDDKEKQSIEESEVKIIKKDYEGKIMRLKSDLDEARQENEVLLGRIQKLKHNLKEKDNEIGQIEAEYQSELRETQKKLAANEFKIEKEKLMDKMKGVEIENNLQKYKKESLQRSACISKLNEEKLKLKEDSKELGEMIKRLKEKNEVEKKSRDFRIEELENENEKLKGKIKKMEEKLIKEIEISSNLRLFENEYAKLRAENVVLKEKIVETSENNVYKEKAYSLEKELINLRNDFEKLKTESIQILKHSSSMKSEVKKVKQEMGDLKRENKKEEKLLIANLEKEFRKRIEEIIKSNLQEKEKMLEMWNEERENWETEMKEDMENSKYELERQLRIQRIDLERDHVNKLTEVLNENNKVVNDLNVRLNELELERRQMELKFDEEIHSAQHHFVAEKEYMVLMIRELLKNLVDSKSRKSIMNQNHKNEIMNIEEKFEKEKALMDIRLREELLLLRNKVNEMLSKDAKEEYNRIEDFLDFIPRKL